MTYDAIVIGAGPAGYVCAIRLAQLGKKAAVVEKGNLGGVCLNVGCIPSKALIAASKTLDKLRHSELMGITAKSVQVNIEKLVAWKEGIVGKLTGGVQVLLKNHKVDVHRGTARVLGRDRVEVENDGVKTVLETANVVLATGSSAIQIPGFEFDGSRVWSSTDALVPTSIPERMLVIGAGYIGLELGLVYHKLGTEVRIVEFTDRVLPGMEPELSQEMGRSLKKKKIRFHLKAKAKDYKKVGSTLEVTVELGKKTEVFPCDVILSTVGRKPNSANLGLEEIGVAIGVRGFVEVDAQRQTNVAGIYAVGDCAGEPMLAHKGSHEGQVAAAAIAGQAGAAYDPACVPEVIFTDPEIASVGLTSEAARESGFDPIEGKFPFAANGRALCLNEAEGWAKVVVDKTTDRLLGVHLIGPEVTELIAEAALAIELGATAEDFASTIHAHPTLPEALMEASEAVHNMAVHIFQRPKK